MNDTKIISDLEVNNWRVVKYDKLIPHNLESKPLELKLELKNNTANVTFCLALVADGYDPSNLTWTMCLRLGPDPTILSNVCETKKEVLIQKEQLENRQIIWNVTKTGNNLYFSFEVLGKFEHKMNKTCNEDTIWVLFQIEYPDGTTNHDYEESFFYKSATPGINVVF